MTGPTDAEIFVVAREAGLLPDNSHPAPETRVGRKHSNAVQAFARAVLAKWGVQPVPAGYALVPVDPTYVNIQQRCAEVMEWRRTGILRGNVLREYSEEHWAGYTHELQLAEQETSSQAMTMIAKMVAQPVSKQGGSHD